MNFLKRHKLATFIIVIYIAVVIVGYFAYKLFTDNNGMPLYGDRLEGIEQVEITKEQKDSLVKSIKESSEVVSVSEPHVSGRTYNIVITFGDTASDVNAKKLADVVTNSLTKEQNDYYDVQVFLNKKYNCTLEATGVVDEDGVFTSDVKIKFKEDLSKDKEVLGYGINTTKTKEYNAKLESEITVDGEFVVYGYTQDKVGEVTCSIKIVRKASNDKGVEETTINSAVSQSFPLIGYKRKGSSSYVWTKDR